MPETLSLWPQSQPGAATLTVFPTQQPNGAGVLICPGGGYAGLATDHEGAQVARWLNARGYNAWMLQYSVAANRRGPLLRLPLHEAQRAIKLIRANAAAKNAKAAVGKIGVWGFSAGGHLAATLSTRGAAGAAGTDAVERGSSRPDFQILAYAVITMDNWTHAGSRFNLLGANPDAALIEEFSNERRVTAQTPPCFLFHTADDPAVPVANSIKYFEALRAQNVAAEMHVYQHGAHGVGLAQNDPILSSWPARLEAWLAQIVR